jgi:hypothetical protein
MCKVDDIEINTFICCNSYLFVVYLLVFSIENVEITGGLIVCKEKMFVITNQTLQSCLLWKFLKF